MMQQGFLRHGVMVAFESFEHFRKNYEEVIQLFHDESDESDDELSSKSYENDGSFSFRNLVGTPSSFDDSSNIHMLNSPTRNFVDLVIH